jgi:hypothetical protein
LCAIGLRGVGGERFLSLEQLGPENLLRFVGWSRPPE